MVKYDKPYSVYLHESPNGKFYVGLTCADPVESRWGSGGVGYKSNIHFWNAIQHYGWDNFKHAVIYKGLSFNEACNKEHELILFYKSNDERFGYNHTSGGDGGTQFTQEIRDKISRASAEHWKDPEYRQKVINKLRENPMKWNPEQIKRISESNKRTKKLHPRTPEQTEKWRKSRGKVIPWNKGIVGVFHHSDETKKKLSEINKGKVISDKQRMQISQAKKGTHHTEAAKKLLQEAALRMSDETKAKISATLRKRYEAIKKSKPVQPERIYKRSEEARKRISESLKGHRPYNCKPIKCVETGEIYYSIAEASRILGISDIREVLDDPNHCRKGLHFISLVDERQGCEK